MDAHLIGATRWNALRCCILFPLPRQHPTVPVSYTFTFLSHPTAAKWVCVVFQDMTMCSTTSDKIQQPPMIVNIPFTIHQHPMGIQPLLHCTLKMGCLVECLLGCSMLCPLPWQHPMVPVSYTLTLVSQLPAAKWVPAVFQDTDTITSVASERVFTTDHVPVGWISHMAMVAQ